MARAELPRDLLWLEPLSPQFPSSCNSFAVHEDDGTWTFVDPGSAGESNLKKTRAELERHGLRLERLGRILITHPHVDHLGAAAALRAQGIDVPVLCHPDAAALARDYGAMTASFDFDLAFARFPNERNDVAVYNERIERIIFHAEAPFVAVADVRPELHGETTITTGDFTWECIPASGHCPGHVMFYSRGRRMLVAGDMVGHNLAWHSPSSGGAAGYLATLERVAALDVALLLPAHGDPSDNAPELVERMHKRLMNREEQLLDLLRSGPKPYAHLYAEVMKDPGRTRLFPFVPMLEGHIRRLAAIGSLRESEPGLLERC